MDVRCEKCQTEYELDEARLKPAGVTVKCTNCGHMFKIRKRANTNVGAAPVSGERKRPSTSKPPVAAAAAPRSNDAIFTDDTVVNKIDDAPSQQRQWLIRLENGDQKSCQELASLQQWIVAGIVTRESLISRTGKTWKRLGDIGELAQYFTIADETRAHRTTKPTGKEREQQLAQPAASKPAAGKPAAGKPAADMRATMLGVGTRPATPPASAGGTILNDDVEPDEEVTSGGRTGTYATPPGGARAATPPPRPPSMPPPPGARTPAAGSPAVAAGPPPAATRTLPPPQLKTPPMGTPTAKAPPAPQPRPAQPVPPAPAASPSPAAVSSTIASMSPPAPQAASGGPPTPPPKRQTTSPVPAAPPPTPKRSDGTPPPPPAAAADKSPAMAATMLADKMLPAAGMPPVPAGNRATATWATDGITPKEGGGAGKGPSGPFGGKLTAIPDEPAFAGSFSGRVRTEPTDASVFSTGKVKSLDDDDDALPARRGSRAGMWIALLAIVVIGGSAATIFAMMRRNDRDKQATKPPADAAVVAVVTADASTSVTPIAPDASAPTVPAAPFTAQRSELLADVEGRLLPSLAAIASQDDPPSLAMRAHLGAAIAQDLRDRAMLADKADGDKLREDADKVIVDAASLAPRALKAAPDDPTANLAMAEVLRLQKKPARDVKRYLDAARGKLDAKADPQLAREIALADGLVLARDGKLDDARAAFAVIDEGEGKLEASGDVRARFHVALALNALGKAADAKPLVDQILAAQPEHAGARALAGKLATAVATADPLPPEEHHDAGVDVRPAPDAAAAVAVPHKDAGGGREPGPPDNTPPTPSGDYNHLVAQGNKVAESNCTEAMKLFQRALEQNPAGADALTGIGYCQLDAKQFSSAYSKFSAALAVDPRHEGALAGIAEMYQQQGKKEKAIDAWKAYQQVYPSSAKAQKQLDRLGAGAPPPDQTPPTPTPTPTPPAPTPAPAPAPAGSDGT